MRAKFVLDFNGSKDVEILSGNAEEMVCTVVVNAYTKEDITSVRVRRGGNLKMKYR